MELTAFELNFSKLKLPVDILLASNSIILAIAAAKFLVSISDFVI